MLARPDALLVLLAGITLLLAGRRLFWLFVGVASLAAALSEERDALEDIHEPFLIQAGFLDRTPRGRVATARAYEYFGLTAPQRDRLW